MDKENYSGSLVSNILDSPEQSNGTSYSDSNYIKSLRVETITTGDDTVCVSEPSSDSHSQYPYNKVEKSLSGHVKEIDDTPGSERIMEMHRSGTYREIISDGTEIVKVFGDGFSFYFKDKSLVVSGNLNITVEGDCNLLTKGSVNQKIAGDYNLTVHGNMTTRISGERLDYCKLNHYCQTSSDYHLRTVGSINNYSEKDINIQSRENMYLDSEGSFIQYVAGNYKVSVSGSYGAKSESNMNLQSSSNLYLDASQVHANLPSSGVTTENPETNDIGDKDPTGGLTVEMSTTYPLLTSIQLSRLNSTTLFSTIQTNDVVTYPKDRTIKLD